MIIPPKPLIDVQPGDPIRSEDWNNILAAVRVVYTELSKTVGTLSVVVKNKADGNPIPNAIVTVIPTGETGRAVRTGVYAGADLKKHQVPQLLSGAYNVVVETEGFGSQTKPVTMDEAGNPLEIIFEMEESLFPMPSLFGRGLEEAIKVAKTAGFQVGRIIDSHGKDIPSEAVPDDAKTLAVLGQVPEPGTPFPKNGPVLIHVAAKAEFVERVKVPDLRGLNLEEAKAKLEASHLVLGETSNVGSKYVISR